MNRKIICSIFLMMVLCLASACERRGGMPNPASVFCEDNGGKLEIRKDPAGNETGMCVFEDGSMCEEWAYFRGECAPGGELQEETLQPANMANPASVYCEEHGGKLEILHEAGGDTGICIFDDGSQCEEWAFMRGECSPGEKLDATADPQQGAIAPERWSSYSSSESGYSFLYPTGSEISRVDGDAAGLTITGPLANNEHWPMISISHPKDREEYRPPEGVDLKQWLSDHNLVSGDQQPDRQIAGVTALHTRLSRGQQSFASDWFYFTHEQQLYVITILHTGDHEDWSVYDQFLNSIQFD